MTEEDKAIYARYLEQFDEGTIPSAPWFIPEEHKDKIVPAMSLALMRGTPIAPADFGLSDWLDRQLDVDEEA